MLAGAAFTVTNNRQRPISPLARRNSSRRKTSAAADERNTGMFCLVTYPRLHVTLLDILSVAASLPPFDPLCHLENGGPREERRKTGYTLCSFPSGDSQEKVSPL